MSDVIYVVGRMPVLRSYIPNTIKGVCSIISEHKVIKRTPKGYRLKVPWDDRGSMYLDTHYKFFDDYNSALNFLESAVDRVISELDQRKQKAVRLKEEIMEERRKYKN